MLEIIINAIRNREALSFVYDGLPRVVHPAAVGISRAGNPCLRCYQVVGGHVKSDHDWNFCEVSQISSLVPTGQNFLADPPGYKKGDKHLNPIYAEL